MTVIRERGEVFPYPCPDARAKCDEILEKDKYIKACLTHNICPKCGRKLDTKAPYSEKAWKCMEKKCGYIYRVDWRNHTGWIGAGSVIEHKW